MAAEAKSASAPEVHDPARNSVAPAPRDATWDVLSNHIKDLIVLSDLEGTIFYVSPSAWLYGYKPSELIGMKAADFMHPDDLGYSPSELSRMSDYARSQQSRRERRFRCQDGSWVWLEGNPSILEGAPGVPVGRVNVFRDITDRRADREALAEQARRAAMAEEVAGVGYWRLDAKTLEATWSPQVFRMHGLEVGDTVALARAMDMVHPDDKLQADARVADSLANGTPWQDTLTRIVGLDGHTRYLSGRGVCETDADGKVTGVFGTVLDVTDQEVMKAQLRDALAEAERAAAVKAEFLANMSHEIRTPLTAVLGFAGLLTERDDLDVEARGHVARIASASRALLAVVNDVLDFSKLEAGEVAIHRRPSSVERAGREVLEMFALQAEAKGVALAFEAANGLPESLILDDDRLRQILINLVGNAVKFTEAGKVSLSLDYDDAGAMVAEVRDTGPGIAPEAAAKLFQRFSQVDGSSTRSKGGAGLGLAICRGLAEAMGGQITMTSRIGDGSTFRLALPALRAGSSSDAAAGSAVDPSRLCGLRVLVADDNAVNRELVRAILEPAGVEVTEVCDGAEAVTVAQDIPFDVILMDLRMPRLDGRGALAAIRQQPGPNQHMPILAFSADGAQDPSNLTGFQGAVAKPIAFANLLGALLRAVETDDSFEQETCNVAA